MEDKLACRPPYKIVVGKNVCWSCNKEFDVVGVVVSEALIEEGFSEKVYLIYVKELPDELLQEIQAVSPYFRKKFTVTTETNYFANVCPHCGEVTGDHFLYSEPNGAFGPGSDVPTGFIARFDRPMTIASSWGAGGCLT